MTTNTDMPCRPIDMVTHVSDIRHGRWQCTATDMEGAVQHAVAHRMNIPIGLSQGVCGRHPGGVGTQQKGEGQAGVPDPHIKCIVIVSSKQSAA